ncbi:MAG: phosphatase PAP2 family protein [Puniceicoccales bacterium]|nr:phosphatase PAP2 family protein [Puniceicoccales bacterium]
MKESSMDRRRRIKCILLGLCFAAVALSPLRCSRWDSSRWIRNTGDMAEVIMPCLTTAVLLLREDWVLFPHWLSAGAATALSVHLLKHAIPARRPGGGRHSFPSGHTATAFLSACFLLRRYGPRWGVPMLLLACFVGFSRVYSHSHYLRDVLAGALIGFLWAHISGFIWRKLSHYFKTHRKS